MAEIPQTARPADYTKPVALVLQGGGALGSYQAGVYEALAQADYTPNWVVGISIGAINAAIIAGNAPQHRVEKLRAFWREVSAPSSVWPELPNGPLREAQRRAGAVAALLFGQPGFFQPQPPLAWITPDPPTSYYRTAALRGTLERLVDFDRINSRETRFSVAATNVRTGNFAYFDNTTTRIRPEHVMASGALPPGFPAVEIDGEQYWDGGLVSNTPLLQVMQSVPRSSRLIFQVDLFPARGKLPRTLDEVTERQKDIGYSSRTRLGTSMFRMMHDVSHNVNALLERLPAELKETPEAHFLRRIACVTTMDIVHLIYRPVEPQGPAKDFEFSRQTMQSRWDTGKGDAARALAHSPWLAPMPPNKGVRIFDAGAELHAAAE